MLEDRADAGKGGAVKLMLRGRTSVLFQGLVRLLLIISLVAFHRAARGGRQEASPGRAHTLTGRIQTHAQFHSRFLSQDRDILVYLPPDYERNRHARYPVLYLHDGQNLFDGATSFIAGQEWRVDETAQQLIESGKIQPLIVVGIYNVGEQRMAEYTPTRDKQGRGGGADAYGRMLVEELKPFIDKTYRTRRDAANTGLGGSSLGGLVSLYLGLKYPRVFGKLAIVSPSAWWDEQAIIRQARGLRFKPRLRIWLDMGTHEGRQEDWQQNVEDARLLRDALLADGWQLSRDLQYVEAEGAEHNEAAWAARVGDMLQFLYPPR